MLPREVIDTRTVLTSREELERYAAELNTFEFEINNYPVRVLPWRVARFKRKKGLLLHWIGEQRKVLVDAFAMLDCKDHGDE